MCCSKIHAIVKLAPASLFTQIKKDMYILLTLKETRITGTSWKFVTITSTFSLKDAYSGESVTYSVWQCFDERDVYKVIAGVIIYIALR